jgi:hypothetical protein
MQIVALDGTKLIVLMLAGGAFALAGLWLMFRPQPEGEAARIELFGLKVQASSAGLLVFLIGAAFLAVPIFVPERAGPLPQDPSPEPGSPSTPGTVPDLPLPRLADTEEVEPNDAISNANALVLGQTVRGALSPGDFDWYVVSTETTDAESLRVTFRNLRTGCPQFDVLDAVENRVIGEQVCSSAITKSSTLFIDDPRYYIRVNANNYRTDYELVVSAE